MKRKVYKEFDSMCSLGVTLEHNGFQGGNAGHGGFVKITMEDLYCTAMKLNGKDSEKFEISFLGDAERVVLVEALEMIIEELKSHE